MERKIPYQNFYVYEISGEISDSKNFFREDFIGCWNEGEISCLFFSAAHDEEVWAFTKKRGFGLLSRNVMDSDRPEISRKSLAHLGRDKHSCSVSTLTISLTFHLLLC